jgi:hypothetical protein
MRIRAVALLGMARLPDVRTDGQVVGSHRRARQAAAGEPMTTPRKPDDYVLIDGDKVYDVKVIERFGGGWLAYHQERKPPPPRWREWLRVMFAAARLFTIIWIVRKLATLYIEAMRPS